MGGRSGAPPTKKVYDHTYNIDSFGILKYYNKFGKLTTFLFNIAFYIFNGECPKPPWIISYNKQSLVALQGGN